MIIEIDGPAMAYFGDGDNKIVYRTLQLGSIGGASYHLMLAFDRAIQTIKREVDKHDGVIYWRQRPALTYDFEDDKFVCKCRLAVEPPILEGIWKGCFYKEEGSEMEIMPTKKRQK